MPLESSVLSISRLSVPNLCMAKNAERGVIISREGERWFHKIYIMNLFFGGVVVVCV